jgi:hypothetical protein
MFATESRMLQRDDRDDWMTEEESRQALAMLGLDPDADVDADVLAVIDDDTDAAQMLREMRSVGRQLTEAERLLAMMRGPHGLQRRDGPELREKAERVALRVEMLRERRAWIASDLRNKLRRATVRATAPVRRPRAARRVRRAHRVRAARTSRAGPSADAPPPPSSAAESWGAP